MKKSGTDHRTRLTKFLIRRALLALMRKKPIQSISVKELCELAGINRGTFYAHYRDVYDLLGSIEEEMLQVSKQPCSPSWNPTRRLLRRSRSPRRCFAACRKTRISARSRWAISGTKLF